MENKNASTLDDISFCVSDGDKDTSTTSQIAHGQQLDQHIQHQELDTSDEVTSPPNFVSVRQKKKDTQSNDLMRDQLNDFKEEMRRLMTFFGNTHKSELADLNSTLKEVQKSNVKIENSIEFLAQQNEELKSRISELENNAKEDRQYILFLESKVVDLQMNSRKANFELKNVPRKENESKDDLIEMITHLSKTVNCEITKANIKDIYRVRGKPEQKNTPIIIETTSALLKADFLKMTKSFNVKNKNKICAKHLGIKTQGDTPVYVSEHLTAHASRLFFLARDLKKGKGYKFCWTSYGKVYVRKTEQSPVILIRSEEQVHQLISKS